MTTDTLADRLTPLAAQLADILDKKAQLEQAERIIKAQIRDLVDGPDTYAAGNLRVIVSSNRRFNQAKALPLIPAALAPVVTHLETVIDKDKFKALAPDLYEQACDSGDDRISLR